MQINTSYLHLIVSKNREVMKSKAQFVNRRGSVVPYVTKRLKDVVSLGSGLQRSYSRLSDLGFLRAFSYPHIQWRPNLNRFVSQLFHYKILFTRH